MNEISIVLATTEVTGIVLHKIMIAVENIHIFMFLLKRKFHKAFYYKN